MSNPHRAADQPIVVDVVAGQDYYWCSCGLSQKQPFCDSSHKGSSFLPVKFSAKTSGKVYFCACKLSQNAPLCDGSHKR